jgi:hypothetical protein
MKHLMRLQLFISTYLIMSFVQQSFNCSHWTDIGRFLWVACSFAIIILCEREK